jgi:hypothetical protein
MGYDNGASWEEARMMIMDKLSHHTAELSSIKTELTGFKSEFQIGMTELKTKMMIGTTITNLVVGSVVAFVMSKVLG